MVHLHADNCVGQNKNNTMLHYLIWRVLHQQIILSFLIVGHTKFSPDWCFGLLKQRFRRTRVGCLADLEQVVNISAETNVAQLVGTQSGEVVHTYDWTSMFVKQYNHFTISASTPGSVFVKVESDSESSTSLLINHTWSPTRDNLPPVVVPSGLSLDRQWYLYNQIGQYCPDNVRDVVCPRPLTPLSCTTSTASTSTTGASTSTAEHENVLLAPAGNSHQSTATAEHDQPPAKRARVCSKCKTSGHNARTCGK